MNSRRVALLLLLVVGGCANFDSPPPTPPPEEPTLANIHIRNAATGYTSIAVLVDASGASQVLDIPEGQERTYVVHAPATLWWRYDYATVVTKDIHAEQHVAFGFDIDEGAVVGQGTLELPPIPDDPSPTNPYIVACNRAYPSGLGGDMVYRAYEACSGDGFAVVATNGTLDFFATPGRFFVANVPTAALSPQNNTALPLEGTWGDFVESTMHITNVPAEAWGGQGNPIYLNYSKVAFGLGDLASLVPPYLPMSYRADWQDGEVTVTSRHVPLEHLNARRLIWTRNDGEVVNLFTYGDAISGSVDFGALTEFGLRNVAFDPATRAVAMAAGLADATVSVRAELPAWDGPSELLVRSASPRQELVIADSIPAELGLPFTSTTDATPHEVWVGRPHPSGWIMFHGPVATAVGAVP